MLRETLCDEGGAPSCGDRQRGVQLPEATTPGGTGSAPRPERRSGAAGGRFRSATTTYARLKDFGNYVPATLVVEKQLEPSNDPGRFDLLVNGRRRRRRVRATARSALRKVRPGAYTVSEVATAAGTNPANYRSTVECKVGTRRTQTRARASVYENLTLCRGHCSVHLPQRA